MAITRKDYLTPSANYFQSVIQSTAGSGRPYVGRNYEKQ